MVITICNMGACWHMVQLQKGTHLRYLVLIVAMDLENNLVRCYLFHLVSTVLWIKHIKEKGIKRASVPRVLTRSWHHLAVEPVIPAHSSKTQNIHLGILLGSVGIYIWVYYQDKTQNIHLGILLGSVERKRAHRASSIDRIGVTLLLSLSYL